MPDLGKYAFYVLSAYGVSLVCLAALIWESFRRAAKARAQLAEIEARTKHG